MENLIIDRIQERHQLEISALRLRQRREKLAQQLRQAKFDSRSAWEQSNLYEGSIRSLLDKLRGKKEEQTEALARELRRAEAELNRLTREQELLFREIAENQVKLEELPEQDDLWQQAAKDSDALQEWYRLDALYCIEAVMPLLEENHTALIEHRNMMSGANVGKVYTFEEQAEIQTAPEKAGEACKVHIQRLEKAMIALEIPFEPGSYFSNPTGFINASAAAHNRRDRLNQALDQVAAIQKQLPKLRIRLEK